MGYNNFSDIDLPNKRVTKPNPTHIMAFRKFSSDQVVKLNKRQVDPDFQAFHHDLYRSVGNGR